MPYTGVAVGLETYRAEGVKFDKLAAAIRERDATIANMAKDTVKYASRLRETTILLRSQQQLTTSAQTNASVSSGALAVTQREYIKAKPKWYESAWFLVPASFAAGSGLTIFGISKIN